MLYGSLSCIPSEASPYQINNCIILIAIYKITNLVLVSQQWNQCQGQKLYVGLTCTLREASGLDCSKDLPAGQKLSTK
jgi:hypothetical protein